MPTVASPNEIAQELSDFGAALIQEQIVINDKPIQDAAQDVTLSNPGFWHYRVSRLVIEVGGKGVKFFPETANGGRTFCGLDVHVQGHCSVSTPEGDPIKHSSIQIELSKQVGTKQYRTAWHHDCQALRGAPHCVHPRYHLSFGGNRLYPHLVEQQATQYSNLLLVDSPRIAHPPLDAVLAVDFVLSHFAPARWQKARANPDYVRVLKASQRRLWLPFFAAAAKECAGIQCGWNPGAWPQLV